MVILAVFAFSKQSLVNDFTGGDACRQKILNKCHKTRFKSEFKIMDDAI